MIPGGALSSAYINCVPAKEVKIDRFAMPKMQCKRRSAVERELFGYRG